MEHEQMRFAIRRAEMVKRQLKQRGITENSILAAFGAVPRERFVPISLRDLAYDDRPLPIGEGQTISQPFVVAAQIQLLELRPTDRVLEVGVGSGYAAAVLGQIVAEVFGLERIASLAKRAGRRMMEMDYHNVHVRHGDGTLGWEEKAPFNGIMVSAGGPEIPPALKTQLALGGRLVMPVGAGPGQQILILLKRTGVDTFEKQSYGRVSFVPLIRNDGED